MLTYIIMILISIISTFLAYNAKKKYDLSPSKKQKFIYLIFCFLAFLPPFLVSALRAYHIGTDTNGTYIEIYYKVLNSISIRDIGYFLINKVAIILFGSYRSVLVITSLIINALSYISIFKESKYPITSVILFFSTNVFFISMNMIRQSIATSIFIFAIPYIKKRKFIKFFLCMLISTSIHTSAIIYFPMYFLFNINLKRKHIYLATIITILFGAKIVDIVINILLKSEYFRVYFAWYISSTFNSGNISLISLIITGAIIVFLLLIYNNAHKDKDYNILLWSQVIAFLLLILSAKLPLMQRTSWLFTFSLFVYLPKMFEYIKNLKMRSMVKFSILSCYILYMILTIFILGYNEVYPYASILGGN